jgi:hypothetical protein
MTKVLFASLRILLPLMILVLATRCANPVMPSGGIKDTDPPEVVSSIPLNKSVMFNGRTLILTFNEFVKLEKAQQQILISPPPQTNPEFRLRGKSLIIRFEEDLFPNTTYSVFFGDAIVDLTENNPLSGYTFVFSTGAVLDSMNLRGNIFNAFDLKPAENVFAMLYLPSQADTIPADSLPYLKKPYYVTRTDKNGKFRFNNLKNEQFKIFALSDMNSNFIYDMAGELIAFSDSLIMPEFTPEPVADSLITADSLEFFEEEIDAELIAAKKSADSLLQVQADSLTFIRALRLAMFQEVDSTQKLLRAEIVRPGLLRFAFRQAAYDVEINPLDTLPDSLNIMPMFTRMGDTLLWYFKPGVADSIHLTVTKDTLIRDTLHISLIPRQAAQARRLTKRDTAAREYLSWTANIPNRKLEIETPLHFSFDYPIVYLNPPDSAMMVINSDTLNIAPTFSRLDSIGLKYQLDYSFEPGNQYNLTLPDSVFMGLNGHANDTMRLTFKIPPPEDYGNLLLDIGIPEGKNFVIQLLGTKEIVLREFYISESSTLNIRNLFPGKYRLKAIDDRNHNRRWDTGNYLKKIQPEAVYYFSKELEIRANWDFEESWELK